MSESFSAVRKLIKSGNVYLDIDSKPHFFKNEPLSSEYVKATYRDIKTVFPLRASLLGDLRKLL